MVNVSKTFLALFDTKSTKLLSVVTKKLYWFFYNKYIAEQLKARLSLNFGNIDKLSEDELKAQVI